MSTRSPRHASRSTAPGLPARPARFAGAGAFRARPRYAFPRSRLARALAVSVLAGMALLAPGDASAQTAATILSVTKVSADGTYTLGDTISVNAVFSAAVTVTGTPQLALEIGSDTLQANYASGSGTQALRFDYEVAAGNEDTDGISVILNGLTLNGGTITAGGIAATLTHGFTSFAAILVDGGETDTTPPTLVSATVLAADAGATIELTFDEAFVLNDAATLVAATAFSVTAAGNAVTVGNLDFRRETDLTYKRLRLQGLSPAITPGQTVIVSYTDPTAGDDTTAVIQDAAGNDVASFTTGSGGVPAVINNVMAPPEVSSVALTSAPGVDSTYAISETVTATVTFDAAVDIAGSPELELDFGGSSTKAAACAAATNTTTMACSYTVAVGDEAAGGIRIGANKLTGDSIYATGSTTLSADLDHGAVTIDAGHKVDGIRPTLVTTGDDAPTTSTDGTQVILTFSEDLSAVDRSQLQTVAGGAIQSASVSGRTVTLTLYSSVTIAAGQTVTLQLSTSAVKDVAGNGNLHVSGTITVINAVGVPTVTGVALTSTPALAAYDIGGDIEATVTFSDSVDIAGSPELELDFDGTAKAATCATGTNTTTMACTYTVATGDSAPNGVAIGANKLTGDSITATGSTTAAAGPRPRRRGDGRRSQGRRHPPDARRHRRRCADDVDRRHAGDPDLQRDPPQHGHSIHDHHPGQRRHRLGRLRRA